MIKTGALQKDIAAAVKVSPSALCRELKRNAGKHGQYLRKAHQLALAQRKNKSKKRISDAQWQVVESYLKRDLSPEQISIRLNYKKQFSISQVHL